MADFNRSQRGQRRNAAFGNRNYSDNMYNINQGNTRMQTEQSKKSGTVYSKIKKGKNEGSYCVNAWRKTKNGLMTASAFPVDNVEHSSQDGNISLRYVVEIVNRDLGTTQTYWCMMSKSSKKIYIKELDLVISPNGNGITSSGKRVTGFFGKAH